MSAFEVNFPDYLALKLHVGAALRVYHVHTPAATCPPIFVTAAAAAAPDLKEESTICESHFLAVARCHATFPDCTSTLSNGDALGSGVSEEVLVFAIEVLIFDTPHLTTIFVSKADSTGFLDRQSSTTAVGIRQGSSSIIRTVTSAFLEWIVSRRLEQCTKGVDATTRNSHNSPQAEGEGAIDQNANGIPLKFSQDHRHHREDGQVSAEQAHPKKVVLSLFARSQNQYLFPGSIENETKHVLDDRQLIKWWCRVLDGLLQRDWPVQGVDSDQRKPVLSKTDSVLGITIPDEGNSRPHCQTTASPHGYLIVPGCDRVETKRLFLPTVARSSTLNSPSKWSVSYPVEQFDRSVPLNGASVPVRYMIPRLPDDPKARFCDDLDDSGVDEQKNWKAVKTLDQFWELMSYRQECSAGRLVGFAWVIFNLPRFDSVGVSGHFPKIAAPSAQPTQKKTDLANFTDHPPSEDGLAATVSAILSSSGVLNDLASPDTKQVTVNHEALSLSSEDYNKLTDYLINTTDFAGLETAKQSTRGWIAKLKELSRVNKVGMTVHGKALLPTVSSVTDALAGQVRSTSQAAAVPSDTNVNLLVGVRKRKRKGQTDDVQTEETSRAANGTVTSMTTDAGRAHGSDQTHVHGEDGAKILAAGLVRKKPKPKPAVA